VRENFGCFPLAGDGYPQGDFEGRPVGTNKTMASTRAQKNPVAFVFLL